MTIEDIDTIAVLGAGNMGHGISEVAALAGYEVNMRDVKEAFVREGYDQIEWSLEKLADSDRIGEDEAEAALDRVTPLVDLEGTVAGADVVVEAVPEQMEIKREVYAEVGEHAPGDAIFATNTSSLSITALSEATDRPGQFCGMHFFNPPVRMDLVEVIYGAHTDDGTIEAIEALAEDLGKTPVRVRKDSPGFVVNRILVPLMNEACWLASDEAATVAEVDSTVKFGMGLPMGAFELADMTGIDVSYHVLEYMNDELGRAYEPASLMTEKVENEALGRKTGVGFYDYEDGDGAEVPTDEISETVEARLLATVAREIGNLVGGGVAPVEDIDEAVLLGAGFPEGPGEMVDDYGLDDLVGVLEEHHEATDHPRFTVPDALREAADAGGFHA